MKNTIYSVFFAIIILFFACNNSQEYFVGKWKIMSVIENDKSFSLQENWIHLKQNGTFESYGGELKKKENGTWIYESKNKILFIDALGEDNDSEWQLELKNDTLFFHSTTDDSHLASIKYQ